MTSPDRSVAGFDLRFSIRSDINLASICNAALRSVILDLLGEERGEAFALSCAEAVNNAVQHASSPDSAIEIALHSSSDWVDLWVGDAVPHVDLANKIASQQVSPYENVKLEDLPESGLGLFLIGQGSDEVRQTDTENGKVLILRRRRSVPVAE